MNDMDIPDTVEDSTTLVDNTQPSVNADTAQTQIKRVKDHTKRWKKLDRIAEALIDLGYSIIYEDEKSITFKVDTGLINFVYGYPRKENPIKIEVIG